MSSESLHPVTGGGRFRDPETPAQAVLLRRGRKNCWSQGGSGTSEENPQKMLAWLVGTHRVGTNNQGVCMGLTEALCMYGTVE